MYDCKLARLTEVSAQVVDFNIRFKDHNIQNGLCVLIEFRTRMGHVFYHLPLTSLESLMIVLEITSSEFIKGSFCILWFDPEKHMFKYIGHAINPNEKYMELPK